MGGSGEGNSPTEYIRATPTPAPPHKGEGSRDSTPLTAYRQASIETIAFWRNDPPKIFHAPWVSPPATTMLMS